MITNNNTQIINLQSLIPVTISKQVSEQIDYLCRVIPNVEWSGVLFYTAKGNIQKNNLKITVVDILPMDKGSSSFTSFSMDNRVVDYLIENNAVERNLKMGLIHSHHNMQTFFSGEDLDELKDGAKTNNIYLSLIVNNRGERSCKIAYEIGFENKFKAKNQDGKEYSLTIPQEISSKISTGLIFSHDCTLTETKPELKNKDFISKVQNICERPSFASTKVNSSVPYYNQALNRQWSSEDWYNKQSEENFNSNNLNKGFQHKPQTSVQKVRQWEQVELEDFLYSFSVEYFQDTDFLNEEYFLTENLTISKNLLLAGIETKFEKCNKENKTGFYFEFIDYLRQESENIGNLEDYKSFLNSLESFYIAYVPKYKSSSIMKNAVNNLKILLNYVK